MDDPSHTGGEDDPAAPDHGPAPAAVVWHGVDFSGGRRAERKIRVATASEGTPAWIEAGLSHSGLVDRVEDSAEDGRRHAWLIDATFGLPIELLREHQIAIDWRAAAEWLSSYPTARDWRRACRRRSRKEHRRPADREARTPFAPTNLRMFRQTWHCIVSVLLPLRAATGVALWPIDTDEAEGAEPDRPADPSRKRGLPVWVGEGCPASTLLASGLSPKGYKGPSDSNRARREDLLRHLEEVERIGVDPEARALALSDPEGDALDSLLLLPAARRFSGSDPGEILRREPAAAVEGWVYL